MNPNDFDRWKSEVLDEIFAALAADDEIEECLVFKGARVLNARLGGGRQSLDLDSNLTRYIDCKGLEAFIEQWEITAATYIKDSTIPVGIGIEEARSTLETIVKFMIDQNMIPFE